MRRTGATIVMASLILCASSGCGTMLNMQGKEEFVLMVDPRLVPDRPTTPFGGVANDMRWIRSAKEPSDVAFALVDMPFSFVGDVVTLPWAIHETLIVVRPNAKHDDGQKFWMESPPREKKSE